MALLDGHERLPAGICLAAQYAPRRRRTTGIVCSRILMSQVSDQRVT
jgi:hypothetical protein